MLLARWGDPAAHRAYLDRFADLEGLGIAGRRYRTLLDARPGDVQAMRGLEEVLRRAVARGLSMLPRTRPRRALGAGARRIALAAAIAVGAAAASGLGWLLLQALAPAKGTPP